MYCVLGMGGGALSNSLQGICRDGTTAVSYEFVLFVKKSVNSIVVLLCYKFDGIQ